MILASGLDARGYRLSWPAGTVVFEIDQPEVLAFKAATLTEMKAQPTADVRELRIDLRDDWPAALRQAGFDADRPSAWIAEGLLAFLPSDAQDRLFDNITALSADGSRLAAEIFLNNSADADGERTRESMEAVTQRWRDNGFDLEIADLGYPGERNDVITYLDGRGWRSARTSLDQLLADAGLPVQHTDGEEAFGENYYCTSVKQPPNVNSCSSFR